MTQQQGNKPKPKKKATAKKARRTAPKTYIIKGRALAGKAPAKRRRRTNRKRRGLAGIGGGNGLMVLVFLVIVTGGGYLLWDWWKKKYTAGAPAGPSNPAAPQIPASNPVQLPAPQVPAPKTSPINEVNNAFFSANPFAYADGAESVNIRETPSQSGKVIFTAKKGQYIGRHTGKSTDIGWPSNPGTWAKITLTNGAIGWGFSGLLKSEKAMRTSIAAPVNTVATPAKTPTATPAKTPTATPIFYNPNTKTVAPVKTGLNGLNILN